MMKGPFHIRRPDPLLLLVMVVVFSALMSTTAAAETFFSKPDLDDLRDGDVRLARISHRGPAVHMSVISPADVRHGRTVNASDVRQAAAMPEVYLSVRLPW